MRPMRDNEPRQTKRLDAMLYCLKGKYGADDEAVHLADH